MKSDSFRLVVNTILRITTNSRWISIQSC